MRVRSNKRVKSIVTEIKWETHSSITHRFRDIRGFLHTGNTSSLGMNLFFLFCVVRHLKRFVDFLKEQRHLLHYKCTRRVYPAHLSRLYRRRIFSTIHLFVRVYLMTTSLVLNILNARTFT
jgi:hypothetical protein